jgi:drug/metabolite transporter (DMT)-like permease
MNTTVHRPLVGIALIVLAVSCFAALDTTVKYLSATVAVLLVVWFRYMFQAIVMSGVVLPTLGWRSLHTQHPWLHALRGVLLLLVSTLGFASLKYMPVAEFTAIIMLTPLVVTLMAAVFLKERVNGLRWLLVMGGFVGALLVIQPAGEAIGWPVLLPLGMVVFYAAFQILTGRMARTENTMTMHFYTGWTGALIMTLLLPWVWQPVADGWTLFWLCMAGVFGTVGHLVLILAFKRAPTATLAPFLYAQVGMAMLAGWLVFDHIPGSLELWGIALIVACGATVAWLSAKMPQPQPSPPQA